MNRIVLSLFSTILSLSQGERHKHTITKPYGCAVAGQWGHRGGASNELVERTLLAGKELELSVWVLHAESKHS